MREKDQQTSKDMSEEKTNPKGQKIGEDPPFGLKMTSVSVTSMTPEFSSSPLLLTLTAVKHRCPLFPVCEGGDVMRPLLDPSLQPFE
jgi:hypothetical protein